MKKLFGLFICAIMMSCVFTACGGDDNTEKNEDKSYEINVDEMSQKLYADNKYVDELNSIVDDMFVLLFSVEKEDVVKQSTYTSTGATAELISTVECKDEAAAGRIKAAFEKYAKDNSQAYKNYKPEECDKLDDPVIKVYGKYVVVCISDDNDTAEKIIEDKVK